MINNPSDNLEDAQALLDVNCPSPEEDLIKLSKAVAYSPQRDPYTEIRFLVIEVDDLIAQLRWHIGQALFLLQRYPQISKETEQDDTNSNADIPALPKEMPTQVKFLLRGYIARPEQVFFTNLAENRRGGTAAGWIYHMMIDDAIARSLAILDRLARLVSFVTNVQFPNGKVYFRSNKLAVIHRDVNMAETQRLLEISESDVFNLLLIYRDGWNHERLTFSNIAGFPPVDSYTDSSGHYIRILPNQLTGELLFALANAAYDQIVKALREVTIICEHKVPNDRSNLFPQQ